MSIIFTIRRSPRILFSKYVGRLIYIYIYIYIWWFHGLTVSMVGHKSIAPGFKPQPGYVIRVFHISLRLITHSAHTHTHTQILKINEANDVLLCTFSLHVAVSCPLALLTSQVISPPSPSWTSLTISCATLPSRLIRYLLPERSGMPSRNLI